MVLSAELLSPQVCCLLGDERSSGKLSNPFHERQHRVLGFEQYHHKMRIFTARRSLVSRRKAIAFILLLTTVMADRFVGWLLVIITLDSWLPQDNSAAFPYNQHLGRYRQACAFFLQKRLSRRINWTTFSGAQKSRAIASPASPNNIFFLFLPTLPFSF